MNNYSGEETVNAGTGKELTIKELTELVAKVVGYRGRIEWDTTRPNGTPRKLLDVSKAAALGWTYRTELEDGIRLAYEDFLHNPGKYAEAGEVTAAGRPLFKVADLEHIYLRAYVEAPQLTTLRLGQEVTVYADRGEADRTPYPGRVVWISGEAEFTPKTIQTRDERSNLVYAVKIAVDNSDGQIKLGMYGSVDFTKKTSK